MQKTFLVVFFGSADWKIELNLSHLYSAVNISVRTRAFHSHCDLNALILLLLLLF